MTYQQISDTYNARLALIQKARNELDRAEKEATQQFEQSCLEIGEFGWGDKMREKVEV